MPAAPSAGPATQPHSQRQTRLYAYDTGDVECVGATRYVWPGGEATLLGSFRRPPVVRSDATGRTTEAAIVGLRVVTDRAAFG
jgi:hypothetical protein